MLPYIPSFSDIVIEGVMSSGCPLEIFIRYFLSSQTLEQYNETEYLPLLTA